MKTVLLIFLLCLTGVDCELSSKYFCCKEFDYCFQLGTEPKTAEKNMEYCKDRKGTDALFTKGDIYKKCVEKYLPGLLPPSTGVFVGLKYDKNIQFWSWSNGDIFFTSLPAFLHTSKDKHCAYITRAGNDLEYKPVSCNSKQLSLCQFELDKFETPTSPATTTTPKTTTAYTTAKKFTTAIITTTTTEPITKALSAENPTFTKTRELSAKYFCCAEFNLCFQLGATPKRAEENTEYCKSQNGTDAMFTEGEIYKKCVEKHLPGILTSTTSSTKASKGNAGNSPTGVFIGLKYDPNMAFWLWSNGKLFFTDLPEFRDTLIDKHCASITSAGNKLELKPVSCNSNQLSLCQFDLDKFKTPTPATVTAEKPTATVTIVVEPTRTTTELEPTISTIVTEPTTTAIITQNINIKTTNKTSKMNRQKSSAQYFCCKKFKLCFQVGTEPKTAEENTEYCKVQNGTDAIFTQGSIYKRCVKKHLPGILARSHGSMNGIKENAGRPQYGVFVGLRYDPKFSFWSWSNGDMFFTSLSEFRSTSKDKHCAYITKVGIDLEYKPTSCSSKQLSLCQYDLDKFKKPTSATTTEEITTVEPTSTTTLEVQTSFATAEKHNRTVTATAEPTATVITSENPTITASSNNSKIIIKPKSSAQYFCCTKYSLCFQVGTEPKTAEENTEYCKAQDGADAVFTQVGIYKQCVAKHLPGILTRSVNSMKNDKVNTGDPQYGVFVGLRYDPNMSFWSWSNGDKFFTSLSNFRHTSKDKHCAYITKVGIDLEYKPTACNSKQFSLCQYDLDKFKQKFPKSASSEITTPTTKKRTDTTSSTSEPTKAEITAEKSPSKYMTTSEPTITTRTTSAEKPTTFSITEPSTITTRPSTTASTTPATTATTPTRTTSTTRKATSGTTTMKPTQDITATAAIEKSTISSTTTAELTTTTTPSATTATTTTPTTTTPTTTTTATTTPTTTTTTTTVTTPTTTATTTTTTFTIRNVTIITTTTTRKPTTIDPTGFYHFCCPEYRTCFWMVFEVGTREEKKKSCADGGGHLAIINTRELQKKCINPNYERYERIYLTTGMLIGLDYNSKTRSWKWDNGAPLTYFTGGFNARLVSNTCVYIKKFGRSVTWENTPCTNMMPALCQRPMKS